MTGDKVWDAGQRMAVAFRDRHSYHVRGVVDIQIPEKTAREIALALSRLKQTTFALQTGVEEFLQALNFVTIADPVSVAAHSRMEAGKGMEPAAGDPRSFEPGEFPASPEQD